MPKLKFALAATLLLSSLPAAAYKLDMMSITFPTHNGEVTRNNVSGCSNPDNCYPFSYTGLGVDLFFDSIPDDDHFSYGIWVGQDIGQGRVEDDRFYYGTTVLGYAWWLDFVNLRYHIGLGYGVSYAALNSSDYAFRNSLNDGISYTSGVKTSLFPLSDRIGLGGTFVFKSSPPLPALYARDEVADRRYYEPRITSILGIVFSFN